MGWRVGREDIEVIFVFLRSGGCMGVRLVVFSRVRWVFYELYGLDVSV